MLFTTIIHSLILGQTLFTVQLLVLRVRFSNIYLPLAGLFFIVALVHSCHILMDYGRLSTDDPFFVELNLFKQFLETGLSPLFWLYVSKLTAENIEKWQRSSTLHLLLPLVVSLSLAALSYFLLPRILTLTTPYTFAELLFKVINLVVVVQMLFYATISVKRLLKYQIKLKGMFSNAANLIELTWFRWLILLIFASIALEFVAQYFYVAQAVSPKFANINGLLNALVIWFFSVWALRQRPELLLELAKAESQEHQQPAMQKYQKSAVSESKLAELSEKIKIAMEQDKLYRDPNLSLSRLSQHIHELPNYISQVINTHMNETFFNYINRLRVEEAQDRLKTTNDTVVDIALNVGFNSRSSFYNAFKKATGKTPAAYRKLITEHHLLGQSY